MKYLTRIAIAAVALPAAVTPALANPAGEQAVTNVPWGTTDTVAVGSGGGEDGPGMRITEQGHRDWPDFHAPIEGSPASTAANAYPYGATAHARQ